MNRGHQDARFSDASSGALSSETADRATQLSSARKWAALNEAAMAVAELTGLPPQERMVAPCDVSEEFLGSDDWHAALARQTIDDLAAIMDTGITALLEAHARGADTRAASECLWGEFRTACDGLNALRLQHRPAHQAN